MPYAVQTPVFAGPFDLLLHLILREQVDLYEVDLSSIVDAYVAELERMTELDLEVATEFLLVAATLIELKSRRLLPAGSDLDLDEELALWEERDLLLHRLVECKTFKDAAQTLQRMAGEAGRSYARRAGVDDRYLGLMPDLLDGVTPEQVRQAYLRATAPKPVPTVDLYHVAPIRASVTEAVAQMLVELPRLGRTTFRALTARQVERIEVVVRFLAVLELFKQGYVELDQPTSFGDLHVIWIGGDGDSTGAFESIDAYDG